jgi:acyl-CoA thioester hydrolase
MSNANLLEQVLKLPRVHEQEIPADYLDANGHMNMMYYTLVGNYGLYKFFLSIGSKREEMAAQHRSFFALRQILSYQRELREGENVAVHAGLYAHDHRRLHFFTYIVSLDNHWVSCIDERMSMVIDMSQRKATTFNAEQTGRLSSAVDAHRATGWSPEPSGAIHLAQIDKKL